MLVRLCTLAITLAVAPMLSACKTTDSSTVAAAGAGIAPSSGPNLCVGLRGNGNLIMAHFAALSRITEEFGVIDGTAGGSSASISQFLYESIYANPWVSQCAAGPCSPQDKAARIALLLKSMQGYVTYIENTSTIVAFRNLYDIVSQIKNSTLSARLALADLSAVGDLISILQSSEIKDILNPEILTLLSQGSPSVMIQHAKDVYNGIISTPTYSDNITNNLLFFRPDIIDFHALARLIGRIGSFYAGYGPSDPVGMQTFLNSCAGTRGQSWTQISTLAAGGSTCGTLFGNLVTTYNQTLLANESAYPSRVDDPIGKFDHAIVATAILDGAPAVAAFQQSLANYFAGQPINYNPDFTTVHFGYWGRSDDLAVIASNPQGYTDPKVQMFLPLGVDTWATAMGFSPAEPGISRLQVMSTPRVSAAGWADVSPTHVLKNLGCQKTILVTRQWDTETPLAISVVQLLGATPAQSDALYSLNVPPNGAPLSSSLQAIRDADGVWCTNWNAYGTLQVAEISADSFNAPMELHNPSLKSYVNSTPNVGKRECTVGAPVGTGGS